MSELRFAFREILDEVSSFAGLASDFIAPASKGVLSQFYKSLEGYRNSATQDAFDWKISESHPLTTIGTTEYEVGGGGQRLLVGQVTAKWRIKKEPSQKKSMPSTYFKLIGIASTRIRLRCVGRDNELTDEIAMWRMEIGDTSAPGCFFHSQILGESDAFPFPHSLSIPRLPIIVMTPAAVAEFGFAELFQESWGPKAALQVPHLNRWAPIQKERFSRLLNWKLDQLTKTYGSPWSSLKAAQPHDDLFV
jgi:hypothetical protein